MSTSPRPRRPIVRRLLVALALLAPIAGLLALYASFLPAPLPLTPAEVTVLPAARPPEAMRVSALHTGTLASRAAFAFRGGRFSEARDFAQVALLIQHPAGDLLIDTGMGRHASEHFERTPWLMRQLSALSVGAPAADQLRDAGYDLGRLAGIVPTHVHWDHISGVPDFSGVPVWLGASERAFIADGGESTAVMRDFGDVAMHPYAFTSGPYLGFADSLDVYGDGAIVIVPAPGHTPGSVVVFVTLPSGRRLGLLGDLVWQLEGITETAERPWVSRRRVDHDAAAVRAMISRVAGLRSRFPDIEWLPAHDARAMGALPSFPDTLR